MTHWTRTNIEYDARMAILCLSSRSAYMLGKLDLRSLSEDNRPDLIEQAVLDLIEELRPDLSGGFLFQMRYELHPMGWEFTYCHRSLPPVPPGSLLKKQDLVTGKWYT